MSLPLTSTEMRYKGGNIISYGEFKSSLNKDFDDINIQYLNYIQIYITLCPMILSRAKSRIYMTTLVHYFLSLFLFGELTPSKIDNLHAFNSFACHFNSQQCIDFELFISPLYILFHLCYSHKTGHRHNFNFESHPIPPMTIFMVAYVKKSALLILF